LIPLLKELWDTYKKKIKHIRSDNAGENNILNKQCIEEEMGILFEYTASGTPQQNSIVERAFPAMFGKLRARMSAAGFDKKKETNSGQKQNNTHDDIWIGDTGATCHMTIQ